MTIVYRFFTLLFTLLFSAYLFSQSLVGTQSNYAGSSSLSMNPALMSTSYLYSDFSVATTALSFCNDFLYLKTKDVNRWLFSEDHIVPEYMVNGEKYNFLIYDNRKSEIRSAYESLDVNLLSFMYCLDYKQTVGFSLNGRVYTNGTKIPNEILAMCVLGAENEDFHHKRYQSSDAEVATMEWAEVAMSYSKKLYERYFSRIDVGASLKYLIGYSAAVVNIDDIDYEVFSEDSVMVNNIDSYIAYSLPLDYNTGFSSDSFFDKSFSRGGGIALDLGFSFTHKKEISYNRPRLISACMMPKVDYGWRMAVSLMDLGFIYFKDNAVDNRFVSDNPIDFDKTIFDNIDSFNDMINLLNDIYYDGDTTASLIGNAFKVGLPTTLRLQFDYNIVDYIYVNATFIQPISLFKYSVKAVSQLLLEPRFESNYFDLSIPLTLRDYKHFMVGASARIGFITIGTQNLASYLGFGDVNGMDFFVSLKFNFVKGKCDEDKYDACWSADYGNYKNRKRQ